MITALICTIPRSFEASSYGCGSFCFVGPPLFVDAGGGDPSKGPMLLCTLVYGDVPPSNFCIALRRGDFSPNSLGAAEAMGLNGLRRDSRKRRIDGADVEDWVRGAGACACGT